jgi:phosphoglycerate dehydrogenase-like enzyme
MKPTARLVNTSRGPIVDEQALIETLGGRAIAGAAVDVFDTEPLPANHPFRSLQNLLATPHIGFVAEDLYRTFYRDAAAAISLQTPLHPATKVMDRSPPACAGVWASRPTKMARSINGSVRQFFGTHNTTEL